MRQDSVGSFAEEVEKPRRPFRLHAVTFSAMGCLAVIELAFVCIILYGNEFGDDPILRASLWILAIACGWTIVFVLAHWAMTYRLAAVLTSATLGLFIIGASLSTATDSGIESVTSICAWVQVGVLIATLACFGRYLGLKKVARTDDVLYQRTIEDDGEGASGGIGPGSKWQQLQHSAERD